MKKIIIAFMAAACLLCGCSKDNSNEEQGQGSISITGGGVINAGPEGTEQTITVTSSGDWRLSGVCDWAHPSATAGKSGETVTFKIDPNPSEVTLEATFKFFTGAAVAPLKIRSQSSFILELESEPEMNYSNGAQQLSVKLYTNIEALTSVFSDGGEEWIHFTGRSEAFGSTVLSFTVDANATYENRSSVITLSGEDAEPVTITVNQKQTDVVVPEKPSYSFDLAGGSLSVKLQTNIEYTVEVPAKYATWLHHQTATPPAPKSRALSEYTENFTIDAAVGLRGGKINFKSKDGSYSLTVNIVQSGDVHVYATIPDKNFQASLEDNEYIVVVEGSKCELTMAGQNAETIDCSSQNIKSLEGISAFSKLTSISCSNNPIEKLPLDDLAVTSINMGSNWNCANAIVVSGTKLAALDLNYNYSMQEIDVSECPALADLNISNCYYLTKLYRKTGQVIATFNDSRAGYYTESGTYEKVYK